VASLFKLISQSHYQHDYINDYPREYMETMETCYGKKVIGKVG
jgi:hypothetical protein